MSRKHLPIRLVILLDFLLFALILSTFCYFHHIRILWGEGEASQEVYESFSKPNDSETSEEKQPTVIPLDPGQTTVYDTSGDFGKAHGARFLTAQAEAQNGVVRMEKDEEIRSYCAENGFTLTGEGTYVGLYRSHDLFLTLEKRTVRVQNSYDAVCFVFDLYVRNIENLYTQTVTGRKPLKTMISSAEAYAGGELIAAINGDYTGNTNHCLLAVRNGELIRKSDYIASDICVLYYDGTMETVTPGAFDWNAIRAHSPYQIWNFGPELLTKDGKAITEYDASAYDKSVISSRHPRAAIGYYEPGHYCLVSVDGRSNVSAGLRMVDLANLFEKLGCKQAYNFDGGDSAQSYFGGKIVRQSQKEAQRSLYDIVCVGEVG